MAILPLYATCKHPIPASTPLHPFLFQIRAKVCSVNISNASEKKAALTRQSVHLLCVPKHRIKVFSDHDLQIIFPVGGGHCVEQHHEWTMFYKFVFRVIDLR
jgi:hypothetical protein